VSDFKAKMHQIRFTLGLRPRPPLRELTAPLQTPDLAVSRGLLLRGGRKRGRRERRERGEEVEGGI